LWVSWLDCYGRHGVSVDGTACGHEAGFIATCEYIIQGRRVI
jgi:hypothetical protein